MANSGIRELHDLLLNLDKNRNALLNGPRRIAAAQNAVNIQEQEIEATKQALINQQKDADQKNLQFKMNQQKVVDQKAKLNLCKNNNEYEILMRAIDGELKQNDKIEEEYLGLLERIDATKVQVAELNKALETKKAALARVQNEVKAEEAGLKAEISKYEGLCATAAAAAIPEQHVAYYKRLVTQKGADALAAAVDRSCEGCYTTIPPQVFVNIKTGDVVLCGDCGRFLYLGG